MLLPGQSDTTGAGELGDLIWALTIPQSSGLNEYYANISCSGKYTTSLADDFGTGSYIASDYPYTTKKKEGDVDQLFSDDALTVKVDNKIISIVYDGEYTSELSGESDQKYWLVIPIKAGSGAPLKDDTSDDCTATFYQRTQQTWTRKLLTITQSDNGPRYIYDTLDRDYMRPGNTGSSPSTNGIDGAYVSPHNPNKKYVNYKENFQFQNGLGDGDSLDEIIIQQRMLYGMGADSWCLTRLPKFFSPTGESNMESSKGNLTEVTSWRIVRSNYSEGDSGYVPFKDEILYMSYQKDDVWPWHTNDFVLTEVEAPYGQQQNWGIKTGAAESD